MLSLIFKFKELIFLKIRRVINYEKFTLFSALLRSAFNDL